MLIIDTKKFLVNYFLASLAILVFFMVVLAFVPVLENRVIITTHTECHDQDLSDEILNTTNSVLNTTESCQLVSPCFERQKIECRGGQRTLGESIFDVAGNGVVYRVSDAIKPFGFLGYEDHSKYLMSKDLILIFLFYGLMIVEAGAVLYALGRQKLLRQTFSLPSEKVIESLLIPLFMALGIFIIVFVLMGLLDRLIPHAESQSLFVMLGTPALILLAVFLAPFVEELLFRGILLKLFIDKGSALIGALIVSALFSIVHGFLESDFIWQLARSGTYFILSMIMCWLYIKNKSLWSPIVFHSVYNGAMVSAYIVMK